MRPIDADRALEIVRGHAIAHPNVYHLTNYATLILREAPTVDAVEVVRCKDCKHFLTEKLLCTHEGNMVFNTGKTTYPNCFCSYGERKDGADG